MPHSPTTATRTEEIFPFFPPDWAKETRTAGHPSTSLMRGASVFSREYLTALGVMTALDGVWLHWLGRDFYQHEIGALLLESVRIVPAIALYLAYPLGLVALALRPRPASGANAFLRAALVGLLTYGLYDLTNFATLRGWTGLMTLIDSAWGTLGSGLAGLLAWRVSQKISA